MGCSPLHHLSWPSIKSKCCKCLRRDLIGRNCSSPHAEDKCHSDESLGEQKKQGRRDGREDSGDPSWKMDGVHVGRCVCDEYVSDMGFVVR